MLSCRLIIQLHLKALLGGHPMNDLITALNCFKEALHIYKCQRDEILETNSTRADKGQSFYDTELELDEIDEHVYNASKNIALIQDALLKDKGDVAKPKGP